MKKYCLLLLLLVSPYAFANAPLEIAYMTVDTQKKCVTESAASYEVMSIALSYRNDDGTSCGGFPCNGGTFVHNFTLPLGLRFPTSNILQGTSGFNGSTSVSRLNNRTIRISSADLKFGTTGGWIRLNIMLDRPLTYPGPYEIRSTDFSNLQRIAVSPDFDRFTFRDINFGIQGESFCNVSPSLTSPDSATVPEGITTPVYTVTGNDPDNTPLTYSIVGGADQGLFTIASNTGKIHFKTAPDYDNPLDSDRSNDYQLEVSVTDSGGGTDTKLININVTKVFDVKVRLRALLQGGYNFGTGTMRDDLRVKGFLPLQQPYNSAPYNYSGTETTNNTVLQVTGNNAAVDWVLVELWDSSGLNQLARQATLLQRDGDLMDSATGLTDLVFPDLPAGNYHIVIRHRNHLDIRSQGPVTLNVNSAVLVDFIQPATATLGLHSRMVSNDVALMWAGDIDNNQSIIGSGPNLDSTFILMPLLQEPGNTDLNTNYSLPGYHDGDLNLDGSTLFAGPDNDTNFLLGNVLLYPENTTYSANYIINGGMK